MDTRTKLFVAAVGIGLGSGRTLGAFRFEPRAGANRSDGNPSQLRGRTGIPTVSPGDDGGTTALQLQPRSVFVAEDGEGVCGAGGFYGADGKTGARLSNHRVVSKPAPGNAERIVCASAEVVSEGRTGEVGARRDGWDEGQSEREQIGVADIYENAKD